jgi:hypothetical protein
MLRPLLIVAVFCPLVESVFAAPQTPNLDCQTFCLRYCERQEPVPGYDQGNCHIGCTQGCYWYLSERKTQPVQKQTRPSHGAPAQSYR